MPVVSCC